MERTVDGEVVDEGRAPRQEVRVFDAPNSGTEDRSGHGGNLSGAECLPAPVQPAREVGLDQLGDARVVTRQRLVVERAPPAAVDTFVEEAAGVVPDALVGFRRELLRT